MNKKQMTYQEHLNFLIDIKEIEVAYSELLQLVRKASPLSMLDIDGDYACPTCHEIWTSREEIRDEYSDDRIYNYCPACGQRIDWEGILDE